jgi:glycosyltransferase involved in cell wall biosynthesis
MVYGWDVWFGVSFLRKVALGQVDSAWSISQYTAEKMAATTGYPTGRISLLVPVLSPEQARTFGPPDDSRPTSDGKVRLLSIARLDPTERQKGIDHVMQAMQRLRLEITYTVVGDGGDRRRLEQLAHSLGVDQRVDFAGTYNYFDLSAMYGACDVFVLPSAQEGFGLVYLEAMAAGKPVIAARAGAAPEVVVDGVTGLLVEYGDIESLAAAIDRLSNDAALRRNMGDAGRMRFRENFGFEQATSKVAALLQEII